MSSKVGKSIDAMLTALVIPAYSDVSSKIESESICRRVHKLVETLAKRTEGAGAAQTAFDNLNRTTVTMAANTEIMSILADMVSHRQKVEERAARGSERPDATYVVGDFVSRVQEVFDAIKRSLSDRSG